MTDVTKTKIKLMSWANRPTKLCTLLKFRSGHLIKQTVAAVDLPETQDTDGNEDYGMRN
jgi:hypothetical protein